MLTYTDPYKAAKWQMNAIQMAMSAFGVGKTHSPSLAQTRRGSDSTIQYLEIDKKIYEDNIIAHDSRSVPGYSLISSDITGRAVFELKDEIAVHRIR